MQTYFQNNRDGSYDILLYVEAEELALDLHGLRQLFHRRPAETQRTALVRSVKIIVAGTLALTIPFSFFAKVGDSGRYAMSYVYFGTSEAQIQSVAPSVKTISTVSPSYFNLYEDGTLNIENISESFIATMHASGTKVVPFLSNHWNRQTGRNALANIDSLAASIAKAIQTYNLDGVNVDIENVTDADRDSYTALVRTLRTRIPVEKEVSVAVAANPFRATTGWQGSYDYAALAAICDHLFLMAYDEHYTGGEAGSVASLDFAERSIQYALEYAPPEKIVLGIPFYGRIWGGTLSGYGISLSKIETLRTQYGGTAYYDTKTRTPVMTLQITGIGPTIGGSVQPSGTYSIYYENADSIKEKLALVAKYNLKGAGNWSAGQETADVWDYYELWLSGHYFADIADTFAKDAILKVTSDGIMHGVSDSDFAPTAPLSRAEAAAVCSRLLDLKGSGSIPFSDVSQSNWAAGYISAAAEAHIIEGYPDGTFDADAPITRAEMSCMLSRIVEHAFTAGTAFADVPATHWAYHEIAALAQMGILAGYPDGTFQPDKTINRGEAAVILSRLREY